MRRDSDAEIREQHLVALVQQHILRLDIAVNQPLFVGVLQGSCYLPYSGQDGLEAQLPAFGIALAQRAVGGILHHQKRGAALHAKIEDAQDMRMLQPGDSLRLAEKVIQIAFAQAGMQHFDGCLRLQVEVFAQIDLGKAALAQQPQQPVVAQLLPHAISRHSIIPAVK